MAGVTVGRHVAYGEYLHDGRPSIDLAQTICWEASLVFSGIFTASVPVFLHMLAELGTAHLLSTNHISSGGGSSHQLSALESGTGMQGRSGAKGDVSLRSEDVGEGAGHGAQQDGDDGSVSFATTLPCGGRLSQDSQASILRYHPTSASHF